MFVTEKYYGVNFSKLPHDYIEFRYLGGKDYEKKYAQNQGDFKKEIQQDLINDALLKVSEQSLISDGSFFFKISSPSVPA